MELQLPNVDKLKDMHLQVPLKVYSYDGKLMAQYGAQRRVPVTLDQIPVLLQKALLAVEDARYYSHPGVDIIGIFRAAKAVISSGKKVQGASTITMQVARNFFLTRKKSYLRKVKEILLALKIDKELSKEKVLELYLNKVYFGNRAYGVAAAAQVYYGKPLDQLTLAEMAMLAGLPQAPSTNNPIDNPSLALVRRNHVLARMLEVKFIDQDTFNEAIRAPLTAKYHGEHTQVDAPYIAEMVRQVLYSEYGAEAYERGFKVYTTVDPVLQQHARDSLKSGLLAYTERHGYYKPEMNLGSPDSNNSLNWQKSLKKLNTVDGLQVAAVSVINPQSIEAMLADGSTVDVRWAGLLWARAALDHGYVGPAPKRASDIVHIGDVVWLRKLKSGRWKLTQIPKVQGALISVNPQDGAIYALSGGFDYSLSNFNRATQAERQPGSNFKPFIYSAALEHGDTLATIINDAPVVMEDSGENTLWRPRNDTLKFYGPTRLKVGLTKSRNLVSIRLLQSIGVDYALNYIKRFDFDPEKLPHSLSLALGSGTITPLQNITGFAVFANGGYRVSPYFIDHITDQSEKVIYQATPVKACESCIVATEMDSKVLPENVAPQVLSPQNAYLMTTALQGVIKSGTGRSARVLHRNDLAGKTGSTNNLVDAWFTGFNSKLLTTVWVGFDDLSSLNEYGSRAALPIWIDYMREALKGIPESAMPQPPGIVTVRIDPEDGLLASTDEKKAIFEVFKAGTEPTQYSQNASSDVQDEQNVDTDTVASTPTDANDNDGQPLF